MLVEALVRRLVRLRNPRRRCIVDLLDERSPAVAHDVERVDRHWLVLSMAVVLGAAPSVETDSHTSLSCLFDLCGVCVSLTSLGQPKHSERSSATFSLR